MHATLLYTCIFCRFSSPAARIIGSAVPSSGRLVFLMSFTLTLISKLCSMLLMAIAGYMVVKAKVFDPAGIRPLSNMVAYVLTPCLIINAFTIDMTPERIHNFWFCVLFSCAVYAVWILAARLLRKPLHLDAVDETTLIYSNVGNLILPLISMTLGKDMVFYATAIQIPFNLLVWTHGESLISGQRKFQLKKILTTSNVLATLIGIFIMATGFRFPDFIFTALSGLGSTVGPLSMMVVGMTIALASLKDVFTLMKAYKISLLRLIVFPLMVLALLCATGLLRRRPELIPVFQVAFMAMAAPPAATVSQLAIVYDNKPLEAGIYNIMGVLLCIITIPLMNSLYQTIFPV